MVTEVVRCYHCLGQNSTGPIRNPPEMIFSKLEAFLRKVSATRVGDLINAITEAIVTVSSQEVERYFDHYGYVCL